LSGCVAATILRKLRDEIFKVRPGLDPRGVDIDANGVVWTGLAAAQPSGKLRCSKCKNVKSTPEEACGLCA
jgi:hypothetical protein